MLIQGENTKRRLRSTVEQSSAGTPLLKEHQYAEHPAQEKTKVAPLRGTNWLTTNRNERVRNNQRIFLKGAGDVPRQYKDAYFKRAKEGHGDFSIYQGQGKEFKNMPCKN